MKNDFNPILDSIKAKLKNLITSDSSNEFIESITKLDKSLDELKTEHDKVEAEEQATKDKLVEIVKGTSFNLSEEPQIIEEQNQKSFDELLSEGVNRIVNERK